MSRAACRAWTKPGFNEAADQRIARRRTVPCQLTAGNADALGPA